MKDLQNEEEQLENVKNFRHKIHEEELEAVRDYVEQWLERGEEPEEFIEEHKKRKSSNDGSSRYGNNDELEKMLSDFANDYQKLLDDAYEMEKTQLLKELAVLEGRYNDLKKGVDELQMFIAYFIRDKFSCFCTYFFI